MEFLPGILVVLLNSFSIGTSSGIPPIIQIDKLESFSACLFENGLNSTDIVRRSNSAAYAHLNYQWQLKPPHRSPAAYVVVRLEQDVVIIVRCGRKFKVHLVPKGGGHSLEKYSFGDINSVVVDLRYMDTVIINRSQMSATVGPGMLLGPLYWKLWELGQVFSSFGICPTVGVTGFSTGGGIGLFSRKYGIASDNILEMNIVTADGALLKVDSSNNADLHWALRGGVASSFGIVTQFVFKIFPAPSEVFVGSLKYDLRAFADVFRAWQQVAFKAENSLTVTIDVVDRIIEVTFQDTSGDGSSFENMANKFPISATKWIRTFSYLDFLFYMGKNMSGEYLTPQTIFELASDMKNIVRESPKPVYDTRKTFYVHDKIGHAEILKLDELISEIPRTVSLYVEPYGGAISDVPANATAFIHRGRTLYNFAATYKVLHPNENLNTIGKLWLQKFFDLGNIFHHNESYQNYVDSELTNYLDRYYGSNLPQLVRVKRKYDPDNFFHVQQSIPTQI